MLNFTVNQATCIKCGKCVTDCPARIISLEHGQFPVITQENEANCYKCQHCLAVCPTASLAILGRDPKDSLPLTGNLPDATQMELLIKGRRAVRQYKPENLEPEVCPIARVQNPIGDSRGPCVRLCDGLRQACRAVFPNNTTRTNRYPFRKLTEPATPTGRFYAALTVRV